VVGPDIGPRVGERIGDTASPGHTSATLRIGDLGSPVLTSSISWEATLAYREAGTVGNGKKLHLLFLVGSQSISVTDDEGFADEFGAPTSEPGSVAVLVYGNVGDSPTVGDLEAAITAGSTLIEVTVGDAEPSNVIDVRSMDSVLLVGDFGGGS
jgi:hypothetical protein